MIHGLDTGFLIAFEVVEHAEHAAARATMARLLKAGDQVAIVPHVLAEFIHIVTDSRRFAQPLSMADAMTVAEQWWTAREVTHIYPNDAATELFISWIRQFSLGRKRLLDTQLAACFHQSGISSILTTNSADFAIFGVFACITPSSALPAP